MRAQITRLLAFGVGLLALTGCPNNPTSTTGTVDPTVSTVTVSRSKGVLADGVDKTVITVKLTDKDKNPIKGKDVELVATGSGNTLVQPASPTNDYGVVTGFLSSTEVGTKTISAKVGSLTLDTKPTVEFVSSVRPAASLAFTVQPSAAAVGAAIAPAVVVSLLDADGNVAPVAGTVTLALGANPGGATLGGTVSSEAVDGVATFSDLTLSKVGEGYTLVASSGDLPDATSAAFDVVAGPATTLVVTELPATAVAGASIGFTVTAQDAQGNPAKGYTGTVAITSGDAQAALPAAHTFTAADAGAFSFTGLVLKTVGAQTVTASDGTLTATGSVAVTAGAATRLLVSGMPSPVTAGVEGTVRVVASDDFGNTDETYTGTVKLTVENAADPAAGLPADYPFLAADKGAHDFKLTLKTAGLHDVVAADTADASINGKQAGIQVVASTAAALVVAGLPASVVSGAEQTFTVTGADAFGNTVVSYQGPVSFSTGVAGDVLPPQSMLINGTGSFKATFNAAGTRTLTATDGTLSGTATTTVTPGSTTHLAFAPQPVDTTAGAALVFAVAVKDAQGNTDTSFTGDVTVAKASGPGTLAGTATKAAVAGVATFGAAENLRFDVAGAYTLTATATGPSAGTSSAFNVTAGDAHHLVFSAQPADTAAGAAVALTVTAQDALNNTATGFTGTVTIAKATGPGTLAGTASKAAAAGVAAFGVNENLHFDTVGAYTLTASSGVMAVTSSPFNVTAGVAASIKISALAATATAGEAATFTVTAYDALDNVATTASGSVSFQSATDSAATPKPGSLTLTNGTGSGSITFRTVGSQSVTATFGTLTDTASTTVQAGAAASIKISALSATTFTGQAATFTVTAYDASNNVATGANGAVSFQSATDAAATPKPGSLTLTNGTGSGAITFNTSGTQSVTATFGSLSDTASTTVQASSAASIKISALAATVTAGQAATFTVTAYDASSNVATGANGTVNFQSSTDSAATPASGTLTLINGVGSGTITFRTAGTQSVTATFAVLSDTASTTVQADAAASIKISALASTATAGQATTFTVTAHDAFDNVATSASGSVSFQSSTDAAATPKPGSLTLTNGVGNGSITFHTAGSQSVTATFGTFTDTASTTVQAGPVASIKISALAATSTAGLAATFTVTAYDEFDNVATSASGAVGFQSSTDSAATPKPGSLTLANGVGNGSITFHTAGSQSVTATFGTFTDTASTTVQAGPAASIKISALANPATASQATTFTVTAYDAHNNVATSASGAVSYQSSTDSAATPKPGSLTLTSGTGSGSITFRTAGSQSLTATFGTFTDTATTTVQPGPTVFLEVVSTPGALTVGVAHDFTVTAYDQDLNVTTAYPGTVHFTSSDAAAVLPANSTLTAGTGTFPVTFKTAGAAMTLTATDTVDSGLNDTATVAVAPGPAAGFIVSGIASPYTAGSLSSPTVKAVDAYGNTATGYTGTVHFTSSDTGATLPANTAFVAGDAGVKTFTNGVKLVTANPTAFVKVEDTVTASINGTVTPINVVAGAKALLAFKVQPSKAKKATAIAPAVEVEIRDANGNRTADTDNVTVALNGAATLGGTKTVAAIGGVATFSDLAVDTAGTGYTLTASSGSLTGDTSAAFQVVNCMVAGDCNDSSDCTTDTCNTTTGDCVFTAGACVSPAICYLDACCTPACSGLECGSDGCGGSCAPGCGATEACNAAQKCVYSHTVNLADSATNDFWTGESFNTTSAGYTAYISWDATNIYIGYSGADLGLGDASKWLMVYLDTDPGGANGTSTGLTYTSQGTTMPVGFKADYHYATKMSFDYAKLQAWDGAAWGSPTVVGNPAHGGNYAEFAIPRASIGNPAKLNLVTLMVNEGSGPWTYAGLYTDNFTDGNSGAMQLTRWLGVDFGSKLAPNEAANKFADANASSAQITAVRDAAPGAVTLPVESTLVTYLKPGLGTDNDAVGFYVQSRQAGPGLLVALDPATYSLAVGDRVSFTVTTVASVSSLVQATAITGLVKQGTGDVNALVQDVNSATDLVTALDDYDSELITGTFTVAAAFATSGTGFMAANVTTAGITTASSSLKLRVPATIQDGYDLTTGCAVTLLKTPMFRFVAAAEPSAWVDGDFTVAGCPAPKVLTAVATNATTVVVTFDRNIKASSVSPEKFTLTGNLAPQPSAASVSGRTVTLTTNSQTGGASYTVTVANTVVDLQNTGVDAAANSATFTGYVTPATMIINEVNPNITGSQDLVELLVTGSGSTAGFMLQQAVTGTITTLATLPSINVVAGDLVVVHMTPATGGITNETTSKTDCSATGCYANAWDVAGNAANITFSGQVIALKNPSGTIVNAVPFYTPTAPAAFVTNVAYLQNNGLWFPATPVVTTAAEAQSIAVVWTGCATTATGNSVSRIAGAASNQKSDWAAVGANTWGAANP